MNSSNFASSLTDFEDESFELAESRKSCEEKLLIQNIFEEINQKSPIIISESEQIELSDAEINEIEIRKELEHSILDDLVEEETEISIEVILHNENIKDSEDALLQQQIKEELESDIEIEEKESETSTVFPIPDNISSHSSEDQHSTTSISENPPAFPQETPLKYRSMIPVQSNRKVPLPREIFETPCTRAAGKSRQEQLMYTDLKSKVDKPKKTTTTFHQDKKAVKPKQSQLARKVTTTSSTESHSEQQTKEAPKTISKKQLRLLTERLAPTTPAVNKAKENKASNEKAKYIPQTPCCSCESGIFHKLFEMSTCKKKTPEEEKPIEQPTEVQFISTKSNQMAAKKDIANICNVVGSVDRCDQDNLERIMKELRIIDKTTTEEELEMIQKEYKRCLVNEEKQIYSAKKLEAKLIDSVSLRRHRKFNVFVNHRLAINRANIKPTFQKEEEPQNSVKCSSTMQKETLNRLLATKSVEKETAEPAEKIQDHPKISKASQMILQKSQRTHDMMQMTLEERDSYLLKLRNETVQKLEETLQKEEEKELKMKPSNLGALPSFYDQIPAEKKQRTSKTTHDKNNQFKPKTISYSEFQKMKEKVYGSEPKIAGVEERVKRLRLARIERNELQQALDPRAVPAELKNMKKKRVTKKPVVESQPKEEEDIKVTDEVDNMLGI